YTAAGITGVTASNLTAVTAAVKAGKTVGTDLTKTQIQTLVVTELVKISKEITTFAPVTLTQTGTVAGGDVQYATAVAVIAQLPTNITVTLGDGTTATVPVTWAETDTYDASAAATYTFSATWGTLPTGVN
ncbi:Ig-like domain-containing protein, partial [Lysinibacillus fusiformis]|uniref:Ig-like domain-containing protein n=1 Tax=Lysinibacillus fusiformis TaxID=28031 RepID=UPI0020BDC434